MDASPEPSRDLIVPSDEAQRSYALAVVQSLSEEESSVLVEWARSMLEIRERPAGTLRKAMSAISATKKRRVLWPLLDRLWKGMKSQGWAVKLSAAMMAIVAVCMPGPGAGIAAFGGAIGVPLWVVFGAGGAFAGAIVDAGAAAMRARR